MVAAETGSGKTGAFALPALQVVYETLRKSKKEERKGKPTSGVLPDIAFDPDAPNTGMIHIDDMTLTSKGQWDGCRTNVGDTFLKK